MKMRSFIFISLHKRFLEHVESLETVSRADCNTIAFGRRLYTEGVC